MNAGMKERIADHVTAGIYEAYPGLWERFGERGYKHTKEDNHHHLDHLETAYELRQPHLFLEYTDWLETVLTSRNVETGLIIDNFNRLIDVIPGKTDPEEETFMVGCLQDAIRRLERI